MIRIIALVAALGLVFILHLSGVIKSQNLSHPFWHVQATMTGAGIGVVLTVGLCWLGGRAPGTAKLLRRLAVIGLPVALAVTWYAARYFINSADYEPVAGQFWYFGYHLSVALFVTVAATYLARVIGRR